MDEITKEYLAKWVNSSTEVIKQHSDLLSDLSKMIADLTERLDTQWRAIQEITNLLGEITAKVEKGVGQ